MPQWNSKQWGIVISLTIFLVTMILLLAGPCIIAIIRMIGVVLFVISLALIYKGGEERIYKKFFGIMFFSYLFVYIVRVYLTT